MLRKFNLDTIQLQKEQAPELACTLRRWVWLAGLCLRDEAEGVTDLQAEEELLHFQHHPHKQQSSINTWAQDDDRYSNSQLKYSD